jgi:hypothetical protein
MSVSSSFKKERESLRAVISSEYFIRAPHLTKLLTYLCEAYFEGRSAKLKEYSIAVDGLGRPADSDESGSAVARVQMHRLRAKLAEYYQHEGIHDPVHIVLKPGVYAPQFVGVDSSSVALQPPSAGRVDFSRVRATLDKVQPLHWLFGGLMLVVVVAILVTTGFWRRDSLSAPEQPGFSSALSSASAPSTSPSPSPGRTRLGTSRVSPAGGIRILPGSDRPSVVDALGNIWQGDRYFNGGEAQVTPPALLGLTSDPALFATYRSGDFTYKIPLSPGAYELHLCFADFLGPRLDLQPKRVLSDFRVLINYGEVWDHQSHPLTYGVRPPLETERIFKNISPAKDGFLNLNFIPLANFAFINSISILPTPDGKARPIRIVTQQKAVTDRFGQTWLPDRYFTDGNLAVHGMQLTGTSDPELLAGERYGNFQYVVPVAESHYTVNLYFVETWFGRGWKGSGGVGPRVFQVKINGDWLLRHFDILAETGAPGRVVVKSFPGISPDADGHIVLSFIPIEGDALINAMEIIDEGGDSTHSVTPP